MTGLDTDYASAVVLPEWFARAKPGEQVVYAKGPAIDPREPVVQLVNGWRDEGGVNLHIKRIAGRAHYLAVRRGPASIAGQVRGGRARMPDHAAERELLDYICGLADDGLPMPVNSAVAEALNWPGKEQVQYRLNRLVDARFVSIERPTTLVATARIVTVLATGQQTAGVIEVCPDRARSDRGVA